MTVMPLPQNNPTQSNRVAPLAVLPVFYKLDGRPVLVVGGGDGAAWKAELLAASGAHVKIVADALSDMFAELVETGAAAGSLNWIAKQWSPAHFDGCTIAICDAESDEEASALVAAARAAGVPINIIDNPAFCDFQFGSIVNRSPAVISISTNGTAPILGQALRRRIETLVQPAIGQWAAMASRIRNRVNDMLKPGAERRLFWERFVDRAFAAAPTADDEHQMLDTCRAIAADPATRAGKVTLVGAGPGDAELLTLKAVRALQSADVILFDDLVSGDILELARREAKRMLVGKRGRRESCRQEDINDTMVSLAKAGKHVVRLKGGDPMIFGRAGEEITRLEDAGIPVSVVPGITSALAMASSLGVSLTHRDHAQSVRFITGHSRKGALPTDIDWRAVADPKTTTMFYMGGNTAPEIATTLIGYGLDPQTPVAIVSAITRGGEQRWHGTLADLGVGVATIGLDQPVLIGVGQVFSAVKAAAQTEPERQVAYL